MKIKEGFVLREVMGQSVAVPVGENSKQFHGMIKLNATGAEIWKDLEKGLTKEQIAQRIVDEYESVELEEALFKVEQFLIKLQDAGIAE